MTGLLVIACGAAQTRAALYDDDEAMTLWCGPARGDEGLPGPPPAGEFVAGQVKTVSKAIDGAFIDVGAGRDAFLPSTKGGKPPLEGESVIALVRRPPIGKKGAVLSLEWRKGLPAERIAALEALAHARKIGALGDPVDAAIQAFAHCAQYSAASDFAVVVDDPGAKQALVGHVADGVAVSVGPVDRFTIVTAITDALELIVGLPGGAALRFHETEAGALIDVDAADAAGGSGRRVNDAVNDAAVARVLTEIARRGLGGRIIIDFLPPSAAAARVKLAQRVKDAMRRLPRAHFGRLAADGLCDLTLQRRTYSLLEQATEPAGEDWPAPGRRLTLDWSAKAAIGALEGALAARLSSSPRLIVADDIGAYLDSERPQWPKRLAAKFGARFVIGQSKAMKARRYEIVE